MADFKLNEKQLEIYKDLSCSNFRHIAIYGGGRSGKTTFFVYNIFLRAIVAPRTRHAIIRDTHSSMLSSIFNGTIQKLLSFDNLKWIKEAGFSRNTQQLSIKLSNGSEIMCFGLNTEAAVERILGNEFSTIYCNECSSLDFSRIETIIGSRLAEKSTLTNRVFYDFNPPYKTHWTYKYFVEKKHPITGRELYFKEDFFVTKLNPIDNLTNISDTYLKDLEGIGGKQYQRFAVGEFQDEAEGALWNWDMIHKANDHNLNGYRVDDIRGKMQKVVIGVDPAITGTGDETGIVVCGHDGERYYVLDDFSKQFESTTQEVVNRVVFLYNKWQANAVVVETNQGGQWITDIIQKHKPNMLVQSVRARFGKLTRAEPIASLYSQMLVYHIQYYQRQADQENKENLKHLENQLLTFAGHKAGKSPDRMDALVYAMQYLSDCNNVYIPEPKNYGWH